ncbi:hypothetical protein [Aeromonas sp. 601027]|uniref:hypothetical protein n=1 Tax=Aeromonas sp. 601027 TaxID=2712036 RepID=UPI003BA1D61A
MSLSENHQVNVNGIEFKFILNKIECARNGVIIFMPSAKSNLTKKIHPYFPRVMWSKELGDYCSIYVSDPFDGKEYTDNFLASWFISEDGKSALPELASIFMSLIPVNSGPLIVYGSSMGGFSALYIGRMINSDAIIAEGPQINLERYPTSRNLIDSLRSPPSPEWTNLFHFYRENGFPSGMVKIFINVGDAAHIKYITNEITDPDNAKMMKSIKPDMFEIKILPHLSGYGHVNMQMEEGIGTIREVFSLLMRKKQK